MISTAAEPCHVVTHQSLSSSFPMASTVSRYVGYALLVPSLLAVSYVLASVPLAPKKLPGPVDPGFASLPLNSRARVVYSEDFMEGGTYVQLPMGRVRLHHASDCICLCRSLQVRYWLIGPASGKKVRSVIPFGPT
jgi:hypothetical protein